MYGDIGLCEDMGIIFRSGDVRFPPEVFAASPERWYVLSSPAPQDQSRAAFRSSRPGAPANRYLAPQKSWGIGLEKKKKKKKRENARHIFFLRTVSKLTMDSEARFSGLQEHEVLETLKENKLEEWKEKQHIQNTQQISRRRSPDRSNY